MLLSARGAGDWYGGGAEQSGPLPPRLHRQVHGGQSGRCHGDYFLHGAEQRERSVGGGTLTHSHPHTDTQHTLSRPHSHLTQHTLSHPHTLAPPHSTLSHTFTPSHPHIAHTLTPSHPHTAHTLTPSHLRTAHTLTPSHSTPSPAHPHSPPHPHLSTPSPPHPHLHTLTSPHLHLHTLTSTLPHLSTPSQACVEDDIGQLSASIPSLHAIGQTDDQIADTHSSLSSRSHSIDYETTPTPEKPSDDPKSLNAAEFVTPNGPLRQNSNQTSLGPGGLLSSHFNPHSPHHTHTSSPLHAHTNGHTDEVSSSSGTARSGVLVMPKGDELFFEDEVPFCDCPPDPEIPRGLNLQHLT